MEKQNQSGAALLQPRLVRRSWAGYAWPEWVPDDLRRQIEGFWKEDYGRGPDDWERYTKAGNGDGHPPLGTRVAIIDWYGDVQRGRWVPRWNNIAAIVRDDGTWTGGVSTCELGSIARRIKKATAKEISAWWLAGWSRAMHKADSPRAAKGWRNAFSRTNAPSSPNGSAVSPGGAEEQA